MEDDLSFKITENGIVCLEKVTTTIKNSSSNIYKFTYHKWVGYL